MQLRMDTGKEQSTGMGQSIGMEQSNGDKAVVPGVGSAAQLQHPSLCMHALPQHQP